MTDGDALHPLEVRAPRGALTLEIDWADGHTSVHPHRRPYLRHHHHLRRQSSPSIARSPSVPWWVWTKRARSSASARATK